MVSITAAVARTRSAPFAIETLELDEPRDDEILVRIVGAGMCHTDLIVRDQYYPVPMPVVLGHEGAGVVERIGSRVTKVQPGDHVVLTYASCGACGNCRKGLTGYCDEIYPRNFGVARTDGSTTHKTSAGEAVCGCFFRQSSFDSFALAQERNTVKIRKDVPLEIMGPLACGIQTGAGAVINALKPAAGASIAIFGAGSVGLSAVMAARLVGCTTIVAVDINPQRLEQAKSFGATHIINGSQADAVADIRALTGDGVQYSLETTANPIVFRQAVEALRITGECGLVGASPLGTEVTFGMNDIMFGRTIRGIIEGDSVPDIFIPQLIELWRHGSFPFDRLIKFYALNDINQAAADSAAGTVLKPVLRPGSNGRASP
jgi:aryl-alcohol dehydrogenase